MEEKTPIPENWLYEVGIEDPRPPSPEEFAEALRTLADYPTLFALILDLKLAVQRIENSPKAPPEMLKLVKTYKPCINCLVDDAKLLLEKMRRDYENGQGIRNKEE